MFDAEVSAEHQRAELAEVCEVLDLAARGSFLEQVIRHATPLAVVPLDGWPVAWPLIGSNSEHLIEDKRIAHVVALGICEQVARRLQGLAAFGELAIVVGFEGAGIGSPELVLELASLAEPSSLLRPLPNSSSSSVRR